jgi:predicted O-linked N-acetylglucosamine transferase (SPINDLY family)
VLAPLSRRLLEAIDAQAQGITPFSMLVEDTAPAQQLTCARTFARERQVQIAALEARLAPRPHARRAGPLRVGFLSAGFGEHPTGLLIVELVERLRTAQLQTFAYATTPDDGGALRKRLAAAFHEFHDICALSLDAMLRKIRDDQPDILIDIDGYCEGSHPELLALRAAPLQVNWLAYPGTLGAPWIDYMIADRFVVPSQQRAHYSEKIAYLHRCYQPSDTTRAIADPGTRAQHGLPDDHVVFVCFNHAWKYTLRSFARWTKILKGVPDSVLWLLAAAPASGADEHLRRAVHAAGIDPRRLVFAPRVAHTEHLARYRHADLFLDTSPYNAHTTASDALWTGCPVLTQPGLTFASRVAGSLNHHLGLDELNVQSDQAYVERAVRLAQNRSHLDDLHARVQQARQSGGLFDMAGYAHDFEAALQEMFRRFTHDQDITDFEAGA